MPDQYVEWTGRCPVCHAYMGKSNKFCSIKCHNLSEQAEVNEKGE